MKFKALYHQTLESYRLLFRREPPSDIWSPTEQRFGDDLQHVTVNTTQNWIIPKPRWPRMFSGSAPLFAIGLLGLPLGAATWNPLDWAGPQFLAFYFALMIVAASLALVTRLVMVPQTTVTDGKKPIPLDPYEVACLAAGPHRAVQAAFAAMVQAGTLQLVTEEPVGGKGSLKTATLIHQGKPLPWEVPPLERALFECAVVPASIAGLTAAGMPIANDMNKSLIERGLLQAGPPSLPAVMAGLIMAAPLLVGIPKIAVGLSRERPTLILVIACVVTGWAVLGFLFARRRLSASGRAVLDSLRGKFSPAQLTESAASTFSPMEVALAIGLFGAGWLAVGPLASVHAMLPRARGGGDSSYSGGCGGSGCAGGGCGGGGGGGGCGGGGCGGCGGG